MSIDDEPTDLPPPDPARAAGSGRNSGAGKVSVGEPAGGQAADLAQPRPASLSNAVLFALVAGQVCLHSSMAGLRLALPLMMLRQGGWAGWPAEAAAGVLLGLFALAPVALALPAGRWADRRGYHKPVATAVAMGVVGGLLGGLAAALSPLLAGGGQLHLSWLAALQALLLLLAATLIGTGCNVGLITMQRTTGRLGQGELPQDGPKDGPGDGPRDGPRAEPRDGPRDGPHVGPRDAPRDASGDGPRDHPPGVPPRRTSDQTSAELKRVFSWIGLAPALGNVGGPLLVGLLIDSVGFAWACAAMSLLPLGLAWWARRIPRESPRSDLPGITEPGGGAARPATRNADHGGDASPNAPDAASAAAATSTPAGARTQASVRDLLAVPGIRRLLVINWFFSASWDLHGFVVPLLGHERGMSASAIGSVLGLFAASVATVRVIIPLLARHLHERQVMVAAMSVVASVFVIYPLAHTAVQMSLCAVMLGLALGSVQPMIMTSLHQLAPPHRQGEALALRAAVINLSSSLLPMGFGLVGAALGATLLFRGMAVLLLVLGLPLVLRLRLGERSTEHA